MLFLNSVDYLLVHVACILHDLAVLLVVLYHEKGKSNQFDFISCIILQHLECLLHAGIMQDDAIDMQDNASPMDHLLPVQI